MANTIKFKLDDLPVPGDYWKAPPQQQYGLNSVEPIFTAVGHCLTAWETLEGAFAFLFQRFVGGSHAAARAYGTMISSSGRRDALNEAGNFYFATTSGKEELQKRFRRLLEHFKNASARRNEIAHGVASVFTIDNERRGYFLVPPAYNSNKTEAFPLQQMKDVKSDRFAVFGHDYRYTNTDIDEIRQRILTFRGAAMEYATYQWPAGDHAPPPKEAQ